MNIPKKLHMIWVGSPLPDKFKQNLNHWKEMHPEWTLKLWGDIDFRGWLQKQALFDNPPPYLKGNAIGQYKSDIARYEILHKYGGVYVDVDTYPLRPIDSALEGLYEFAAAEDSHWIGNTYLGSVSGHPVFKDIIEGLGASIEKGVTRRYRPNRLTGPRYLTPIWRKHECHVAPTTLWFPVSYVDVRKGSTLREAGDAYAWHEWSNSQRR